MQRQARTRQQLGTFALLPMSCADHGAVEESQPRGHAPVRPNPALHVQDHFKWNQEKQEPVNFRHHFKTTVSSCLSMLSCSSSA